MFKGDHSSPRPPPGSHSLLQPQLRLQRPSKNRLQCSCGTTKHHTPGSGILPAIRVFPSIDLPHLTTPPPPRMYTCERVGENATEFKYAPIDGGHSGGSGGAWARAAVAVAGASLFAQVHMYRYTLDRCAVRRFVVYYSSFMIPPWTDVSRVWLYSSPPLPSAGVNY